MRKVVTVLFADVAGFTAAGEQLDPEALRRVQSRYFDEARVALERHGASVEKFIGDAVMAVFGIPQVHEDDALRAVRAALEPLREAVAPLEVRIGVNTGEVVAGRGDAPRHRRRGQRGREAGAERAKPGAIFVGEPTYRLVRDLVRAKPVEVTVKGKAEPVAAYRVEEVLSDGSPGRSLGSPLVGREQERRVLADAFERSSRERACHLFTLLGTAGVGKSRLTEEFLADVERSAMVLHGRCLPYGDGITFWRAHRDVPAARGARTQLERAARTAGSPEETVLGGPQGVRALHLATRPLDRRLRRHPLGREPTLLDLVEHVADWVA